MTFPSGLRRQPTAYFFLLGLLFALLSCYPVVGFGKSFLNHSGTPAIYSQVPFLPGGSASPQQEWYRNADLGALLLSIAPNAVTEHAALFTWGEFPWWSRHHGGGVPLWGQAQSMVGDPLHLLPLLWPQDAVAWDVKFILARAVFAAGVGLLVFRHTGGLLAGSLATGSACFLGCYAFWFNHPTTFTLTYAPWLVLAWEQLGSRLARPGPGGGSVLVASSAVAFTFGCQLLVGAPKEGVVVAGFMTGWGLVLFGRHAWPALGWRHAVGWAAGTLLGCVLITAPLWLLFLDALGKAYTAYDTPGVQFLPRFMLLALFDDFYAMQYLGHLAAPSLNPFILACLVPAAWVLGRRRECDVLAAWAGMCLAVVTAYGYVPAAWLLPVPFLHKIHHIGTTFTVPCMVFGPYLAGMGIQAFRQASPEARLALGLAVLGGWALLLGLHVRKAGATPDLWGYTLWVVSGLTLLVAAAVPRPRRRAARWFAGAAFALGVVLVHARFGFHLTTGVASIDRLVTNPTERANFREASPGMQWLKQALASEPARVVGEGIIMFSGFGARLGVESVNHYEALRNPDMEGLFRAVGMASFGAWEARQWADTSARLGVLDALGVRYVLTAPGQPGPAGARLVHPADLDVWVRETAWPRAFFTDRIKSVEGPAQMLQVLAGRQGPFALVAPGEGLLETQVPAGSSGVVRVARAYEMSPNRTAFTVDATGPGLAVLLENYYPGDFVAELNGRRVPYTRVNGCFKGVWIRDAGTHRIAFTYRPERLELALAMAILGALWLLMLARWEVSWRRRGQASA